MITASLQFSIPPLYADLVRDRGPFIVEHAALKSRIPETLLAGLISDPPFGKVVIYSPFPKRYSYLIEDWCSRAGIRLRRRIGGYLFGDTIIWSLKEDDELPDTPDKVLVFDADKITRSPHPDLRDIGICSGQLAVRGHWFYQLARQSDPVGKTYRFTGESISRQFPSAVTEMAERRTSLDRFSYERLIELQDNADPSRKIPFSRFARERLYIRSDKHGDHLNAVQQQQKSLQEGTAVVSFYLSRMQKRYLAAKRQAISAGKKPRFLLLKYRRGGFTTLEQALNYEMATQRSNSYVLTLAHKGSSTERIFQISKLFSQRDPKTSATAESANRLTFGNGSLFFIGTAGSDGLGRGDTLQRVHGSEVSKWCLGPRQFDRVGDLVSGLTGAASNGEVVLETTPNGVEWFAATWKEAKQGQNDWTPIFLPWFADAGNRHRFDQFNLQELLDTLTDREKELIAKFGLTPAQISFRREMQREHKTLFPQEYPEDDISCFLTSGTAYFDTDRIFLLLSRIDNEGVRTAVPGGSYVEWEPPLPNEQYVLGADTSEGIKGGDPCGFGILHRKSGRQVASMHGYFSPTTLAGHIVEYARRYNEALAGVERNNHGHAVLSSMDAIGYSHPNRLYHYQEGRMGWSTDSASRPIMLNDLYDALREREDGWNDREFLDECLSFKLQSNGQFGADPGAHDDMVIKWAIAEQMRSVVKKEPRIWDA